MTLRSVLGLLLAVLIMVFSVLTLVTIGRFRSLWTPSHFYMASRTVADLMVGLTLACVCVLTTVQQNYEDTVACKVLQGFLITALYSTVLQSMVVAVDRCVSVCRPYFYEEHVTNRRVLLSIILVWVVTLGICSAILTVRFNGHQSVPCDQWSVRQVWWTMAFPFVLGISVCGVLYAKMSHVALRHQKMVAVQRAIANADHVPLREAFLQKMKAVKLFVVVFGSFCVCWAPFLVAVMVGQYVPVPKPVRQAIIVLSTIDSGLSLVIYLLLCQDFRSAFKRMFTRNT